MREEGVRGLWSSLMVPDERYTRPVPLPLAESSRSLWSLSSLSESSSGEGRCETEDLMEEVGEDGQDKRRAAGGRDGRGGGRWAAGGRGRIGGRPTAEGEGMDTGRGRLSRWLS